MLSKVVPFEAGCMLAPRCELYLKSLWLLDTAGVLSRADRCIDVSRTVMFESSQRVMSTVRLLARSLTHCCDVAWTVRHCTRHRHPVVSTDAANQCADRTRRLPFERDPTSQQPDDNSSRLES